MSLPNIVLIFTDQQRFDTIHAAGNPIIKTPNLDRLVREGVLYRDAYTPSPVCVPARCSLILGQYPHNTRCVDNGDPMPVDRPTFMQVLADAGYRTHGVGKMHFTPDRQALRGFGTRDRSEEGPARADDDDYLRLLQANGYTHVYDPMGPRGEMYYIPQPAQMPARLHNTQWVGDRAVDFIEETPRSQPFCLFASFIHPHPPFSPPTPWNKLYRAALMPLPKRPDRSDALQIHINRVQNRYKYRDNGIDNNLLRCIKAYYYACISFVDYQVGLILEALEQAGELDNTLILFTSDHGEYLGDYDCFGKRGMLDACARIPMIARFPGRAAAGQVCRVPTSLVDVMPTFLAAAGLAGKVADLDGVDLAEIARRESRDVRGRTVYSQFQRDALGVYMAVNARWKYFYSSPDRQEFLMDRREDPEEMRNRAGLVFNEGALQEMRSGLFDYYRGQGYDAPLAGNAWRQYPQPQMPVDPDAGLLIQDPRWSQAYQAIPGYSD